MARLPAAETAGTDPVELINRAYAAIDGFQATYHSEGTNKSLDATVGLDKKSGLSFFRMEAVRDGGRMDGRTWSTQAGTVYMGGGADLYRMDLIANLRSLYRALGTIAEVDDSSFEKVTSTPGFFMEKDRVVTTFKFGPVGTNPWSSLAKDGVVKSVDVKRIVVNTANWGEVTFDAKTGVLIRQVMKGAENEERVLELSELKLNPGAASILEVTGGWKADGAKSIPAAAFAGQIRSKVFRGFIDLVDKGNMKPEELEKFFSDKHVEIRNLVADLIREDSKLLHAPFWKKLLDQAELRKTLAQHAPGGGELSEDEIDTMFLDRKFRDSFRDTLVARIMDGDDAWKETIHDFLNPEKEGAAVPQTGNGKSAEAFMERYLAKTLYTIIIDRNLDECWGRPS